MKKHGEWTAAYGPAKEAVHEATMWTLNQVRTQRVQRVRKLLKKQQLHF